MIILRILSGLFLLAATLALISEATHAQLGMPGAPFTPLLDQLATSTPKLLATLQRTAESGHALLWDPVVKSILSAPAWIILGSFGVLFGWLGRRRHKRVKVFTN